MDNSGSVKNSGEGNITVKGAFDNKSGGNIINENSMNVDSLNNQDGASITNSESSEFTSNGDAVNAGDISNSGTFKAENGKFTNSGKYANETEDSSLTAQTFENSGTGEDKGFTNKGSITVTGDTATNSGTFTNEGTFLAENSTFNNSGNALNSNNGKFTVKNLFGKGGIFRNNATDEGKVIVEENLDYNSGEYINEDGSTTEVQGTTSTSDQGKITNNGTFDAKGAVTNDGTITNSGENAQFTAENAVTNGQNSKLENKEGGQFNITGELTNNGGTITNDGADSHLTVNDALNNTKGTIDNTNGAEITANGNIINGDTVNNTGTITNEGYTFTNNGTLNNGSDTLAGSLALGSLENSAKNGNIKNASDSNITIQTSSANNGTISNEGTITNQGNDTNNGKVDNKGTYDITGNMENTGTFNNTGESASLSVEGKVTNTANGDNGIKNSGEMTLNEVENDGSITNSGKGHLELNGKLTSGESASKGAIINSEEGIIDLTGDASGYTGSYSQTGGITNVTGEAKFFGGDTNITNGKLNWQIEGEAKNLKMSGGTLQIGEDRGEDGLNLTLKGESIISDEVTLNLEQGGKLEVQENSAVTFGNDDKWAGDVKLSGGILEYGMSKDEEGVSRQSGGLNAELGKLKFKNGSEFDFKGNEGGSGSIIKDEVQVELEKGAKFNIEDDATFNLDQEDIWAGTITIDDEEGKGGTLNAMGVDNTASGGGLHQKGGKSNFTDSNITLNGKDSSIRGGEVSLNNSTLNYAGSDDEEGNFKADKLTMEGNSKFGLLNGKIDSAEADNVELDGTGNFTVDFSPRDKRSDKFDFKNVTQKEGALEDANLYIDDFSLQGKCPLDRTIRYQLFESVQENVNTGTTDKLVRTPVGYYGLKGVDGDPKMFDLYLAKYVPEEFRGQAAVTAMYSNQLQVEDMITNHFVLHDQTMINKAVNANKYSAVSPLFAPYQKTYKQGGLWSKSYVSFDKLDMKQNLRIGNNIYGTIAGFDLPAIELKKDWTFVPTGYVGYTGAHQHFQGVSSYQNAGQLGFMGSFIKNNDFITSILAYGGGYTNEMNYSSYNDNTGNWFAGSAIKSAYNLHASKSFTIQPNVFVAYNAIGKQNWHSNYGDVDMGTGMLNGVNVAPGVNFIFAKETWSLYAAFQYMFFINDKVKGNAANIKLPDMKLDHGVFQYGFGATKTFKDKLATYGQINIRNAGITGVGFQFGLQYLLDNHRNKKANASESQLQNPIEPEQSVKKYITRPPEAKSYDSPIRLMYLVKKEVKS